MPEFQTVRLSDTGHSLFSAADVERLMRAEFDRARRHKHPLVVMLVAVDRLVQLQDLYGWESKEEILRAVVSMLRATMRDSDLLGLTQDDRLLLVFPHTLPESAALLARRLTTGARKLRFDRDGRTLRVTLSVGGANNRQPGEPSFETLVAVAAEGLSVADAAGGDRYVETELYQLHERRERQREKARAAAGEAPGPEPIVVAVPGPEPLQGGLPALSPEDPVGQALIELLAAQGFDGQHLVGIAPEDVARAIRRSLEQKRAQQAAPLPAAGPAPDKDEQIDVLERRGMTEEELRRVAAMKGVEFGLPSIYKTVQGLRGHESNYERKKDMMRTIFQANLELKRELSGGEGGSAQENP
jgi:diguanylate cyclase (GGDEF)-like protein